LKEEEFTMPKTRPRYPPEFRRQMVELARAGRTPRQLAREFEPSYETIRSWVRQANRYEGLDRSGTRPRNARSYGSYSVRIVS
jgi:transposase-like protein